MLTGSYGYFQVLSPVLCLIIIRLFISILCRSSLFRVTKARLDLLVLPVLQVLPVPEGPRGTPARMGHVALQESRYEPFLPIYLQMDTQYTCKCILLLSSLFRHLLAKHRARGHLKHIVCQGLELSQVCGGFGGVRDCRCVSLCALPNAHVLKEKGSVHLIAVNPYFHSFRFATELWFT